MNIVRGLLAGAVVTILGAGVAIAQSGGAMTEPQLNFLDKDGNDAVTAQEYGDYLSSAFDYLDADRGGSLTRAELGDLVTDAQFSEMDANGNGRVSRQEILSQGAEDFATADRDGSGQLQ